MELLTVITPPNNSMQPTALRAAADAKRSAELWTSGVGLGVRASGKVPV
jgi:hypothetical protein